MTKTLRSFPIHRADPSELDDVVDVLNQAAARLTARGVDQWPADFRQDGGKRVDVLRERIVRGEVWLIRDPSGHDDPIGTISLSREPDPDFAHAWPGGPDGALYAFRMATADGTKGMGLGSRLLDFASLTAANLGLYSVRFDCSRTNMVLHRYYADLGFRNVATVEVPGRKSGALWERAARLGPPVHLLDRSY